MTRFEELRSMDVDGCAEWIDKHATYEGASWEKWFDEEYCQQCESVMSFVPYLNVEHECAWCELNGKCRYFTELEEQPSCKDIVKMWLESEVEV